MIKHLDLQLSKRLFYLLFGLALWLGCQPAIEAPRVRLERAILFLDHDKADQAIEMLDRLAVELPDNSLVFYNRAMAYERIEEFEQAIADYAAALKIDPEYSSALNNRGVVFARQKKFVEAIADFEKLVELYPDDAPGWVNLGLVHQKLKDFRAADRAYQRADLVAPDAELHYLRGCLSLDEQKYSDAERMFSHAIEADPKMVKAWMNRGLARLYRERSSDAIEDFRTARDLDEDLEFAAVIDVLLRSAAKSMLVRNSR